MERTGICIYVCVYVCMCACMCVCMASVCMYVCRLHWTYEKRMGVCIGNVGGREKEKGAFVFVCNAGGMGWLRLVGSLKL